jgi:hypothetical protein
MVDGENEGNPYPGAARCIHLPFYCSDNILLRPETLAALFARSVDEVQQLILDIIRSKRNQIFGKHKFFAFLADELRHAHLTAERLATFDTSVVVDELARRLGTDTDKLTRRVVDKLHADGDLHRVLASTPLLAAMETAPQR